MFCRNDYTASTVSSVLPTTPAVSDATDARFEAFATNNHAENPEPDDKNSKGNRPSSLLEQNKVQ